MADNLSVAMTRTLLVTCAVLFAFSQQVNGACMPPPPPCEALAQSQVVFYGEVLEVTSRPHFVGASVALLSVRFNVLRAFKGVEQGPFLETFYYGSEGGRFEPRMRYLVYAIRNPGTFLIVGCTRSQWLAANNSEAIRLAEMSELEMCPKTK